VTGLLGDPAVPLVVKAEIAVHDLWSSKWHMAVVHATPGKSMGHATMASAHQFVHSLTGRNGENARSPVVQALPLAQKTFPMPASKLDWIVQGSWGLSPSKRRYAVRHLVVTIATLQTGLHGLHAVPLAVQASPNVTASSTSPLREAEPVLSAVVPTNQGAALCKSHAQEIANGMTGFLGHVALHLVETERAPATAQSFWRRKVVACRVKGVGSRKGRATMRLAPPTVSGGSGQIGFPARHLVAREISHEPGQCRRWLPVAESHAKVEAKTGKLARVKPVQSTASGKIGHLGASVHRPAEQASTLEVGPAMMRPAVALNA